MLPQDRLRAPKMSVPGHYGIGILFAQPQQSIKQSGEVTDERVHGCAQVEPNVERYLLIPATAGMNFG